MRKDLPLTSVSHPIDDKWEEKFLKENQGLTKLKPLSIVEEFNKFMIDKVCSYRDGVLLPSSMGHLFIAVFPNKDNKFLESRAKNHKKYDVEYSVQERDGFDSRLMYSTAYTGVHCEGSKMMGLKLTPLVNSTVEKAFVNDWKKWIVIPNLRLMKEVVVLRDKVMTRSKKIEQALPAYDEFAFDKID